MTRNTKIVLGVLAGFLLTCMCCAMTGAVLFFLPARETLQQTRIERAVRVNGVRYAPEMDAAAGQVATFTLPDGYRGQSVLQIGGLTMLMYASEDGTGHIMLMQIPTGLKGLTQIEEFVRQSTQRLGYDHYSRTRVIGEKKVMIRGREVVFPITEGTSSDGRTCRVVYGVFEGNGGPAFLTIAMPAENYNQTMIDALIESIR